MRRIAKKTRERVVELLRCAADAGIVDNVPCPLTDAGLALGHIRFTGIVDYVRNDVMRVADRAVGATEEVGEDPGPWRGFGVRCLEAALRVEEGSWP